MPAESVTLPSMATAGIGAIAFAWPFDFLGVPIWGLIAGLVGAVCSYLPRHRVDHREIPSRLLGVLSDAMLGGWLAVFLVNLVVLEHTGVRQMPIEILCGGAGFGMQWLRKYAGPLVATSLDKLFGGVIAAITSTITSWSRRSDKTPGGSE